MISNLRYSFLLFLVVLVYIAGMFVTLFDDDSAQFAVMAMRMVQENDFLNLVKGGMQYLDKPHLHFWLAALSFKTFGLHDWAYRIPALLATLFAAYSSYGLGKLLYGTDTGKLAALIFMTAQTIVLSVIDVRTDAVLTAFTIFSIWQLTAYVEKGSIKAIALGALGAGLAFSTKGQIALLFIGLALLSHLAYTRKWKALLSYKVLFAFLVFAIAIAPMLYAYYHQFDMHPEKAIRGTTGRSGILFIFWEQSLERLKGGEMGANSSDYFFFFHTFLWVFLPWTVLGIVALGSRVKGLFKVKFRYDRNYEFLTLGGITLFFLIISFSQFKLPHYLNISIPLFAVLTASYLNNLFKLPKRKTIKFLLGVQYFLLGVVFIATVLICFYVFRFEKPFALVLLVTFLVVITYFCLKREAYYLRIITLSVCSSLLLNSVLNLHFYPNLLMYQGGSTMAKVVADENIPVDKIYKLNSPGDWGFNTWSMDFYNKRPISRMKLMNVTNDQGIWIYANDKDLKMLREKGVDWDRQYIRPNFKITQLNLKFLNPAKRKKSLDRMHLIHVY